MLFGAGMIGGSGFGYSRQIYDGLLSEKRPIALASPSRYGTVFLHRNNFVELEFVGCSCSVRMFCVSCSKHSICVEMIVSFSSGQRAAMSESSVCREKLNFSATGIRPMMFTLFSSSHERLRRLARFSRYGMIFSLCCRSDSSR